MNKKTLLSGVKPTGRPHVGNYFGAMRQFVDMQNDYNCFFMLADYHALNLIQDRAEMSQKILELAIDYLALGLDPQKAIIFKQSDVSEHTELTWIFDAITTMPYLMRAHAYKDARPAKRNCCRHFQLPNADGGRHFALRHRCGAGWRRPETACRVREGHGAEI